MLRVAVSKVLRDSMMKRGSRRPFRSWKLALYLPQTMWLVAKRSKSSCRRKPRSPFQLAVYFYILIVLLMCGVTLHSWHTDQNSALLRADEEPVGRVLTSGFALPKFSIDGARSGAPVDSNQIKTAELEKSAATGGHGPHKRDRKDILRTEEPHAAADIRKATSHRESLLKSKKNAGRSAESAGNKLASTQGVQKPRRELQQKTTQKSSESRPVSDEVHATSSRKAKRHAGAQEKEEKDLRVTAVEPAHGLRSGGYAVLIRGVNFGPMGSSLIATVGYLPCNETRWLSPEALHCLVPPGRGVNLAVKVHPCSCDEAGNYAQGARSDAKGSGTSEMDKSAVVTFSYEEDAVIAATQHLDMGWTDAPILLHRGLLHLESSTIYENARMGSKDDRRLSDGTSAGGSVIQRRQIAYEFVNKSSGLTEAFLIPPDMLRLLPLGDNQARYSSCAVAGHSGSLIGSRFGPMIDGHEAVFRFDNAPTISRYGPDVGERTTYQVLDHRWSRVLIGASSDRPDHIREVARWWSDTASVVLWSEFSKEIYVRLRQLFPDASVKFLSPDLISTVQATTLRLRRVLESILLPGAPLEEVLEQNGITGPLDWSEEAAPTSLFKTVALATRMCNQVTLFGVYGPCIASKKTCHWRYFDEREPTEPEQRRTEWEETILLALERAGYLNITGFGKAEGRKAGYVEGARVGLLADHETETETEAEKEAEIETEQGRKREPEKERKQGEEKGTERKREGETEPETERATGIEMRSALRECRRKACLPSCGSHGTFRDGKCACDAMYTGADCSESVVLSKERGLLDGLDLAYKGPLRMNREEVTETKDGKLVIKVPEGTAGNHTFDGDQYQVGRKLFSLLPTSDHRPRFNSCAIVGNSGSMLVKRLGAAIDAHEMVWRFNQAPVQGFTPHVGSKTSFEMLNSAWVKQLLEGDDAAVAQFAHIGWWRGLHSPGEENGPPGWIWREPNSTILLYEMFDPAQFPFRDPFQIDFKQKWWRANYAKMRALYPRRQIIALSPQYATWAHNVYKELKRRFEAAGFGIFGGEKPMSGFYAILYCLQICDSIDVYGFTPYRDEDVQDPLALQYHYFDQARPRVGSHSFDMTRYFYGLLAVRLQEDFRITD